MDSFSVRTAVPADAAGVATVHVLTWRSAYAGLLPDSYLAALSIADRTERWAGQLGRAPADSRHLVAEMAGEVVGFVAVGKNSDDQSRPDVGELYAIYVLAEVAGQGIGSALLDAGMAALRESGFKTASLWVLAANHQAQDWYESRGWQPDGRTKVEHREGFDLHEIGYLLEIEG